MNDVVSPPIGPTTEPVTDSTSASISNPTFGRWLKRLRAQHDLTQEALAELAYCSVQTIRFFESGKRRPSLEMAERLAEVLAVPAEQQSHFIKLARTALNAAADNSPIPQPIATAPQEPTQPPAPPRLPLPATLLVGRQPEATRLQTLLLDEGQRLVTLMGPGGIGKTRLALHMAHTLDVHFANGALFVPLVSISNSVELPTAIAGALNKSLPGDSSGTAQLDALLAEQSLLLVLDNFEHLLALDGDAITALIDHIVQHIPRVSMLITSRERLRVAGEHIFELSGLATPDSHPDVATGEAATNEAITSDAVMLFLQRARQVAPAFALTSANRAAIVRLCGLLRGMPLGIELAAAWMRTLTPEEIATEIGRSLDFLTLADRGVPARHRSLRAAFEHSWKLLTPEEQKVAARLAIFRGGFRREGAQTVAGASLPSLAALIDKSLVQVAHAGEQGAQATASLRYEIHELLRQYLRAKLVESGEEAEIARRHVAYYTALAAEIDAHPYATVPLALYKQLRVEEGNLRAALEWTLVEAHAPDLGMNLVAAIGRFWYIGDAWKEGREWLNLAVGHADATTSAATRARLLVHLSDIEHAMADYALARSHLTEAIALWRTLDDPYRLAWTLFQMAVLHSTIAEFAQAEALFEECLALYRTLQDPCFIALVLMQLASTKMSYDDYTSALALLDEAMPIFRTQARTNIVAVALNMQGWANVEHGDVPTAITNFQEAFTISQSEGNYQSMGWSQRNLGMAHLLANKLDEAEGYLRACLRLYQQINFKSGMIIAFEILASVAAEQGKAETSVQWLALADNVRQAIGLPHTPGDERLYTNRAFTLTKAALDPAAWVEAWAAGSQLTLEQALARLFADSSK